MKKLDYFWARVMLYLTGIIFFTQLLIEPIVERREGFEYTVHVLGGLFVCALLYSLILVLWNAYIEEMRDE